MFNFSQPVSFQELAPFDADSLLRQVKEYCSSGKGMHQDSLKAIVLKMTYLSRDLSIRQLERDEAAQMATHLANAAIKMYGQRSDFCMGLVADVNAIVGRNAA